MQKYTNETRTEHLTVFLYPLCPGSNNNLYARYIVETETLYHRDGALLSIAYVMLIWAAPIPADRWHCSLWP